MAINVQGNGGNGNAINVRYSAFLGMLFIVNDANLAAISDVRKDLGNEVWQGGYDGDQGNAAKARRTLAEHGIKPISIDGVFNYFAIDERDVNGGKQHYITVGLRDGSDTVFVSLDFQSEAAQGLIRKLAQAEAGKATRLGIYAFYEKSERNGNFYSSHRAGLKQADAIEGLASKDLENIRGVDPSPLGAKVKEATEALSKALAQVGQTADGKTLAACRAKVEDEFHMELVNVIKAKVDAYRAANATAQQAAQSSPAAGQGETANNEAGADDFVF